MVNSEFERINKDKKKLYVKRFKGGNTEENCKQNSINLNKINHIMRTAERKYYLDLLNEHKSNLKKSWQVLKMVTNKREYTLCVQHFKQMARL